MVMNLAKKIEKWISQGLINSDQGARILAAEQAEISRPWVIYGVAAIGVTAIVTGMVSLIAANWDQIPNAVKLITYFLLQVGLGVFVVTMDREKSSWYQEMTIFGFALLFFGGIGLVAQVFNLHSAPWAGLFFWLVLTIPVVLSARSALINHVWVVTSLITGVVWAFSTDYWGYGVDPFRFRCCGLAGIPLALMAAGFLLQKVRSIDVRPLRVALMVWGFGTFLLAGSLLGNMEWTDFRGTFAPETYKYLLSPWFVGLFTIGANYTRTNVPGRQKHLLTALLLTIGVFLSSVLLGMPAGLSPNVLKIIGAAGFLVVWSLAAALAATANYRRLFDAASFILAVRFIVIYFEVFGDLTTTGFGLIFSGVIILTIVVLWYRFRAQVGELLTTEGEAK